MRRLGMVAAVVTAVAALAGCSGSTSAGTSATPVAQLTGSITVDAASSLSTVLPRLATTFTADHPGAHIRFNFGGSSDLAAAIVAGAPVDVFAAASRTTMSTVTSAHRTAAPPIAIARNKLAIVVPTGNPGHVTGLQDFGDPARTIVLCAPTVPCGATGLQLFALAHVTPKPDSLEQSVSGVLTKVRLGEADAGLVYITDVRAAGGSVLSIAIPEADEALTDVLIAPLAHGSSSRLARAFTAYVVQHGRGALDAAGFLAPSP